MKNLLFVTIVILCLSLTFSVIGKRNKRGSGSNPYNPLKKQRLSFIPPNNEYSVHVPAPRKRSNAVTREYNDLGNEVIYTDNPAYAASNYVEPPIRGRKEALLEKLGLADDHDSNLPPIQQLSLNRESSEPYMSYYDIYEVHRRRMEAISAAQENSKKVAIPADNNAATAVNTGKDANNLVSPIANSKKARRKSKKVYPVGAIKSYLEIDENDINNFVPLNDRQEVDLIFRNPTINQREHIDTLYVREKSLLPTLAMFKSRFDEPFASEAKKVIYQEAQERLEHVFIYLISDLSLNYTKTNKALKKIVELCKTSEFLSLMSYIRYIDKKIEENMPMLKQKEYDEFGGNVVNKSAYAVTTNKSWLQSQKLEGKI